jgi:hypothetical protein
MIRSIKDILKNGGLLNVDFIKILEFTLINLNIEPSIAEEKKSNTESSVAKIENSNIFFTQLQLKLRVYINFTLKVI